MTMSDNSSKLVISKERVFERGRGCWNCTGFENDDLARKRWAECRPRDELHVAMQAGLIGRMPPKTDPIFQPLNDMEMAVHAGKAGLCLRGKAQTDFVHFQYLCDGWTGREGASVATAGRPIDPLPAELHEIAESRAKKADN